MKGSNLLFSLFLVLLIPSPAEQIVFSEVMYHPPVGGHEFIEVQNLTATPFDIAKWELTDGASFTFPDFSDGAPLDSFLKAFERIILCDTDPASFRATYNVPTSIRIFGPWTGQLANGGERITLADKNGTVRCTLRYDDRHPWPLPADGAGHSLVLLDDSPGAAEGIDTDGDGLSDIRENAPGTNPNHTDTDGDGIPDGEETVAGTDPLDALDSFRILSIVPTKNPNEIEIIWARFPAEPIWWNPTSISPATGAFTIR